MATKQKERTMAKSRKIATDFFDQRWVKDWMYEGKSPYVLFYIYLFTACRNNIGVWEINYREWNFLFQFDPPLDDSTMAQMYGDKIRRVKGHEDKIILADFIAYQTSGWGAMQQSRVDEDLAALGLTRADIAELVSMSPQLELGLDVPKSKAEQKKDRRFTIPPEQGWVREYFAEKKQTEKEADKFFDYWTSIGWKRGSRKMVDWEASARTWIGNIAEFSSGSGQKSSIVPKAATLAAGKVRGGAKW